MLDGRPTAALTRVAKFADDPGVTPMMIKALDGTARVLAGETEAGTVMLKEVDWRAFMHQERVVFRSMLEKLGISGLPMPGLMMSAAEDQPDQIPAWRKEVERLEKNRSGDLPPSLAVPPLPGTDVSDPSLPEP
jgi:hypothetical protein